MIARQVWAMLLFEGRRTIAPGRVAVWLVMAMFPAAIVGLLRSIAHNHPPPMTVWYVMLYALTQMVCAVGVLQWATTAVQVELENRTWIYTAVRPQGRRAMLLGRYLVAVGWSLSCALVAIVVASVVGLGWQAPPRPAPPPPSQLIVRGPDGATFEAPQPQPPKEGPVIPLPRVMLVLAALATLGCVAYGALDILIAAMFPKRGMVVALIATFLLEVVITNVPAVINQLTVQFRLRNLLVRWLDLGFDPSVGFPEMFFSDSPVWHHLAALLVYVVFTVSSAVLLLERRELTTMEE